MRISDWSSDVCSSDLTKLRHCDQLVGIGNAAARSSGSTNTPGKNGHGLFGLCAQNCAGLRRDHALFPALEQRSAKLQFQPRHALRNSRSEEHTSELKSLMRISYAVFCLKKKRNIQ